MLFAMVLASTLLQGTQPASSSGKVAGSAPSNYDHSTSLTISKLHDGLEGSVQLKGAGFAPRVVQEASETFTILNLVRAGLGVSLVPSSAERMRVPGLHFHQAVAPLASWRIGVAWHRGSERHNLISRFVEIIRAVVVSRGPTAI